MFLATQSYDGVKVKPMRLFETEEKAMDYLINLCNENHSWFGRIWELYEDKEPRLVFPKREKK